MTSERVYVAIDLETTGLNARQDAIIEMGAVRFACQSPDAAQVRIIDRFVTFVNPGRTIPLRIQQLTGIRDADVSGAPSLEQIVPEILSFVGNDARYMVAHNAGFDVAFLQAGGIDFHRPVQDTFELATILLPGAASYSLIELAHSLDIPLPDAHRALDDAEATARLFGHLIHRAALLPPGISRTLLACGRESQWAPLHLFSDLEPASLRDDLSSNASDSGAAESALHPDRRPDETEVVEQGAHPEQIGASQLLDFFTPGGRLNTELGSSYEYRQGQADMATRVFDAISRGDHLLIEAGTGTGKTLAYLLPATLWATANDDRVVVATNTIALQDQILEKDLPLVRDLCRSVPGPEPRAVLLKGRSNYLCSRRLHSWYRNRTLNREELRVLAKVLVWVQLTCTGDVAELFLPTASEKAIWRYAASDAATCTVERCSARCSSDQDILGARFRDFFHLARRDAEEAHILVVNHALLLTDIESRGRVLPPYGNIVIDEAHRLEEAATEQLTFRADWSTLTRWLRDLQPQGELIQLLMDACASAEDLDAQKSIFHIASLARMADEGVGAFSRQFVSFVIGQDTLRTDAIYTQRVAIDHAVRSQPAWSGLEIEWDHVSAILSEMVDNLAQLSSDLADKQWWRAEPFLSHLAETQSVTGQIDHMAGVINQIIYGTGGVQGGNLVAWVELNEQANEATLVAAPMFVSDMIESELIHQKRSVVLTGATLRTGSGFTFIRERLGLWDVPASTVESPFDYERSTLLFMPSDMPDPRNSHYQQTVDQAIALAAEAVGGSTVALFTSYAQLRATADAIRAPLDRHGITVLQHGTSSRRRLLREYRQTERAVLLGTRSFWEGVDLPGDELKCLLIVRLPFSVPSDPLVAARTADLENAFRDYTLPDAILRFRQGFGRLIRRSTDRGIVVVLDSRVWRKEYGRAFQESLPTCTTRLAPLDTLQDEIRSWLRIDSGAN